MIDEYDVGEALAHAPGLLAIGGVDHFYDKLLGDLFWIHLASFDYLRIWPNFWHGSVKFYQNESARATSKTCCVRLARQIRIGDGRCAIFAVFEFYKTEKFAE